MKMSSDTAKRIGRAFAEHVYQVYKEFRATGIQERPQGLYSGLLFAALERCRDVLAISSGSPPKDIWCRYTVRRFASEHDEVGVREAIKSLRRVNPNLEQPCDVMCEFVFDFSFTTAPRDRLELENYPGPMFQFLLIAESELHGDLEVLKDVPRLVAACAPIKIFIFKVGGKKTIKRIEEVLTRCSANGRHCEEPWRADWLFFGVQTYGEWIDSGSPFVSGSIHALAREAADMNLEDKSDWWTPH